MIKDFLGISDSTLTNILLIGLVFLFSFVANRVVLSGFKHYLRHQTLFPPNFNIRSHFKGALFWFFLTANLKITFSFLSFDPIIRGKVVQFLGIFLILFLARLLTKVLTFLKTIIYSRFAIHSANNLKERKIRTQVEFIEKFILIFIYILSASFILMNFEGAKELGGSLIASAGLAGITLGFAAQKSLSNLLAGFQIAFTQPIRIDDVVIVEGEWGRIEEITLTYVVIRIWDKRTLIVPITYFLEKPFQNWTRASADIIGTVFINLDFTAPLTEIRSEFIKFLNSCQLWDKHSCAVQITNSTERTIEVRFLMSAKNASEAFDLRCLVREHMIHFIKNKFPFCLPNVRIKELGAISNLNDERTNSHIFSLTE